MVLFKEEMYFEGQKKVVIVAWKFKSMQKIDVEQSRGTNCVDY